MLILSIIFVFSVLNFDSFINADSGVHVHVYRLAEYPPISNNAGWEKVFDKRITSILPLHQHQGKSYYMGTHFEATFHEAIQFCNEIHMKLLAIRSAEENERIFKYIREASKGGDYWSSGTRLVDGYTWLWLPYAEPIDFTRWAEGEPNDIDEKCLHLFIDDGRLEWNDNSCDRRFHFICERYNNQSNSRSTL
ncbi:C-type lectin mosGCTL-1 isoform X1 [Leptinotarsa decemlineata]|uniref:C-type lectin mosGCTL-1 isoform X1 n=1 Tax=Leptinotarsa decemlineata TaxID=7539 RepID=UPI003D306209